jgi:predicted transcriptional regulator of viral defense system
MKKTKNNYKIYKSLSRQEAALLNAVEPLIVFSPLEIKRLSGWKSSRISNTLSTLKRKKVILHLQKNKYILSEKVPQNLFLAATALTAPSYISFWTASSYYGFTEQQVSAIQAISTKQYPNFKIGTTKVEVTTVDPKRFFGYAKIQNFALAEKEKLILDCLHWPEKAGGISELKKIINSAWLSIERGKLQEYLIKFRNKSLFARLGYLLEELKLPFPEEFFLRNIPRGFVLLNPSLKPSKKYNQKWKVNIND